MILHCTLDYTIYFDNYMHDLSIPANYMHDLTPASAKSTDLEVKTSSSTFYGLSLEEHSTTYIFSFFQNW